MNRIVSKARNILVQRGSSRPSRYFTQVLSAPDNIIINKKAIQQMKKVCTDNSRLRITVEGGGCSGFQYLFSLDGSETDMGEDDVLITHGSLGVVIDSDSLEYVRGSTLDYNTELIRSAFRLIDNPQAEMGCSCGASFAIKD
ncbi:iron-sulfur cluster assembly 2 homolog, mitochondrial-like [Watersipora subatra]|uniref:iron-sulfur cluster assembly 2 homolog, mitochondrial-like n=1 Tax=Watersipora subatra TaxID=2589382 RepID=UPI00355B6D24